MTFTESEMKKKDYYFVERILRHTYKHGCRFYTKWSGYSFSDCTWEPVTAFIFDDGNVNEVSFFLYVFGDLQTHAWVSSPIGLWGSFFCVNGGLRQARTCPPPPYLITGNRSQGL